MKVIDLINALTDFERDNPGAELSDFKEAQQEDNYYDDYYDDDYYSEEKFIIFKPTEIIPFEISEKALLLIGSKSLHEIFNDCTIYLYGYKNEDPKEYVISRNTEKCFYPFNNATLHSIDSGTVARFEIVSNNDLYCYMGGGVGDRYGHPLVMSFTELIKESITIIDNFNVEVRLCK